MIRRLAADLQFLAVLAAATGLLALAAPLLSPRRPALEESPSVRRHDRARCPACSQFRLPRDAREDPDR